MKRFFLFLITLFLVGVIQAQVSTETYIRSRRMLNASGSAYLDDIAYYDGLGHLSTKSPHGSAANKLTYIYNIPGWLTGISGTKFAYDLLDRMLNAVYGESASITANINRFSENVTGYDKNGNILRLVRLGQTGASTYGLMDNLTYTLAGNQLNRVDDAATVSAYGSGFEFRDAVKQANEYAYDATCCGRAF